MTRRKKLQKTVKQNRKAIVFSVFIILVALAVIFSQEVRQPTMQFGTRQLSIEELTSVSDQEKGLSNRDGITDTHAMFFSYDEPGKRCMWMKDMNFPIDILWLDESKKVINLAAHVPPSSFPNSFCFDNTKYVLEVQAGLSETAGVEVGTQLD